ncbi:hypothetical protein JIX56_30660 [Streptomyces sp. CA-210063]|uniref:hypothetical protein n=1 Tax=Streptomyces sp. CA-210063 TaxID=2801029 RepID=UPI00214C978F|nr:hypothetical protein [Streptomyces sp. CA-210063]UUU33857.1 hypothetical protein JIX56_30660 [Streptomyces sp. CA-210063]
MRALPARRLASSALCATLVLGITASAALAVDGDSSRDRTRATAPVPAADALMTQVKSLDDLAGVLKPVTALLDSVLKANNGQLSDKQAARLGGDVKKSLAKLTGTSPAAQPATSTKPSAPAPSAAPNKPTAPITPAESTASTLPLLPAAPSSPVQGGSIAYDRPTRPIDLKRDALADLQKKVDALLKAATSDDRARVAPAARSVLTGMVNVMTASLVGGGLPKANLPGLPPLNAPTGDLRRS